MKQTAFYNSKFDISEVVPGLSVCLSEAVQTGVVKDLGVSSEPNGIEDVEAVGGRVEDAFEAFDAMHGVQNDKSGNYVVQPQVKVDNKE